MEAGDAMGTAVVGPNLLVPSSKTTLSLGDNPMIRRCEFHRYLIGLFVASLMMGTTGCPPSYEAPPLEAPLSYKDANKLFSKIRRNGARYTKDYEYKGKKFQANWEIGTLLEKKAMVQLKPSTDEFSVEDLYMALEMTLEDRTASPWHEAAIDSILDCYIGLAAQVDDPDPQNTHSAGAFTSEAPYDIRMVLKKYSTNWFCEVKVQNLLDPDKYPGGGIGL